jgi:Mg-chelatase subunit ChlD
VLVARQPRFETDLFLGVLVDCSGSMSACDNIIKARRFAVLVAEAARGLAGVDVRVFGFTDSVIYDAGDAVHSAAATLQADGGNNDAAGLLHLAEVAKHSRRRAKVLVVISDGLPTECSTAALKSLVERLEKREHMVVAQVAVRPLEEQCFRYYVRLDEGDLNQVVRAFGEIVARLVKKALH